ncbi:MAG TPA: PqiC family protein [Thermoanaerobaculia bacterium]|nr:PqiC family protein [Thermoanaerobaculia bacterium]
MRRLFVFALLLVSGCGFFSRTKNTFYSLEPVPGARVAKSGTPIGIEGLELPPGLDRRDIVVRDANHKVDLRGTNQWTAPLEEMVLHTLAFNLGNRLPEGMVVLPGQAKPPAMRSIYITMGELAPGPEPTFVLDAQWTVDGRATHERIEVPMPSLDSEQVVVAMNTALGMLADRIANGT